MRPQPPYYAVIFSSRLRVDHAGYAEAADRMEQLAKKQPGFLGACPRIEAVTRRSDFESIFSVIGGE